MKAQNAYKRWSLEELIIIANTLPTDKNIKLLARTMGRTEQAIYTQMYLMYCSPSYLKNEDGTMPEPYQRILEAKKAVGLKVAISKNSKIVAAAKNEPDFFEKLETLAE